MNLERIKLAFETPRLLSPVSAWVEHIPFGMALVDLLRPATIVELGTHMGDSYCAMCQAVDTLGLTDTRCTAVDTWRGDEQAGPYGAEVLAGLRAHHDPLYGRFSRLLQATFDEAAGRFAPGSIDLLHIDGLHTYEAVRHDWETWRPRMSPRGVMLLHDTQVKSSDFGVWRLWEELAGSQESFEFWHGYGLGVLAAGGATAPGVAEFLAWARRDAAQVRQVFAALGCRWQMARGLRELAWSLDGQREAVELGRGLIGPLEGAGPLTPFAAPEAVAGGDLKALLDGWRRNVEAQNGALLASLEALLPGEEGGGGDAGRAARRRRLGELIEAHAPRAWGRGKSVSVVIPTLNGGRLFGDVLAGLQAQSFRGELEIVVVDSGSTDDTVARARAAGARILEIPRAAFNHGLTRNLGIERTRGDIVMLMTQDAVPADQALVEQLVRGFDDPEVAGVFARQAPRPEHDALVARQVREWVSGQPGRRVSRLEDRGAWARMTPMERYVLCVFDDVCSALRRKVWEEIPLRACDFAEDLDWSKRALEAGWKIVYEPGAAVVHSHDRGVRHEYERAYLCNRALYRLFGVGIPNRRHFLASLGPGIFQDLFYVWAKQEGLGRKLALSCRVPFLVCASNLGQYRGARDERLGLGVRQE